MIDMTKDEGVIAALIVVQISTLEALIARDLLTREAAAEMVELAAPLFRGQPMAEAVIRSVADGIRKGAKRDAIMALLRSAPAGRA